MTIPIARMAATRYHADEMPLRLYYIGSVFRYAEPQAGRHREFTQVGIELIGASGPRADAEVVTLAAGVLESLGLASFRLDLGHIGFFQGSGGIRQRQAPHRRAEGRPPRPGLRPLRSRGERERPREHRQRGTSGAAHVEGRAAMSSMKPAASRRELASPARRSTTSASVYELVKAYGLGERVGVDLGITKDLDYYIGPLDRRVHPAARVHPGQRRAVRLAGGQVWPGVPRNGIRLWRRESDARPRPARLAGARSTVGGGASYGA